MPRFGRSIPTRRNPSWMDPGLTEEGSPIASGRKSMLRRMEEGVRLVMQFNEAFNRHDAAGMMALTSEDCVFEDSFPAPDGTLISGKEAVTRYWQNFFQESPQAHIEIEEIFGFGFRCVMRWRYEWVDAGGNKGHVRGADLFRLKDGLICEKLSYVKG
jgi:predicted SnoaL-like aldol condensation-catalyzing enzyme